VVVNYFVVYLPR